VSAPSGFGTASLGLSLCLAAHLTDEALTGFSDSGAARPRATKPRKRPPPLAGC
jgi:hypothetical protein